MKYKYKSAAVRQSLFTGCRFFYSLDADFFIDIRIIYDIIKIYTPLGGSEEGDQMNDAKKQAMSTLRIARGQIEGTIRMIEEDRYCVDISNQIIAAQSLLKKANVLILKQHIEHCVAEAFAEGDGKDKLDEVMAILSKLIDR